MAPNTAVYNLRTSARAQLTTPGTLNNPANLGYFINGCTANRLEVFATSNANADQTFTLITRAGALPASLLYTPTAMSCVMTNGSSSCLSTATVVIPAGTLIGVEHTYSTTAGPNPWQIRIAVRCQ